MIQFIDGYVTRKLEKKLLIYWIKAKELLEMLILLVKK